MTSTGTTPTERSWPVFNVGRTFVIEDTGARPLTINRVADMHRQQWAKHTKLIRRVWAIHAQRLRIPHLDRVTIDVTPLHKDHRSPQDPAACAAEFKAALDGIVDAGVLDDDDGAHVRAVTFWPPYVGGVDGLRVVLTEVVP